MKSIKAAVIGAGFIGPAHVEVLRRLGGVEVVAVASRLAERAQSLASQYGISKFYGDWREVIADSEVEVVHNCTPNHLHFEINQAAILAGKHVVSEKPLTMTSKQSAELVKLTQERGVVNAINFNYRFYPLIQHARAIMQKGDVGDVYLVHSHYIQDWLFYDSDYNWRLDTELSGESRAVADIGSHWCDLVQFITGLKIQQVFAHLQTVHKTRKKPLTQVETFKGKQAQSTPAVPDVSIQTEDIATVLLKFENGASGVCTVSQVSAGRKNRLWFEIDGSKKALAWDQEEPNQLWLGRRDQPNEVLIKDPSLLEEGARRFAHYPGGHPEGYPDGPKNLFMEVYNFIREGNDPRRAAANFPTFADGHWENLIVEAILRSHREQRWVEVK